MSALGHKRTSGNVRSMSALPPKADIGKRAGGASRQLQFPDLEIAFPVLFSEVPCSDAQGIFVESTQIFAQVSYYDALKRTPQWAICRPCGLVGQRRAACTGPFKRLLARSSISHPDR
jgi:hypothetical protein